MAPDKPTKPKRPKQLPDSIAGLSPRPPVDPPASPHPASYATFNSALTAGLLNPMSPPPPLPLTRASPSLLDMMASEPDFFMPSTTIAGNACSAVDRQLLLQERVEEMMASFGDGMPFNDAASADVKLALSSSDGLSVTLNLHRQFLVAHSRFFRTKLSGHSSMEIADCDDVETYLETLCLMYCGDIRRRLMKQDVSKVLAILKVSAEMGFDAGVLSCLEYLEAAPWTEEEEEKVAAMLSQLRLEGAGAGEVLKRVSIQLPISEIHSNGDEIVVELLQVVLEGKDEKARREMKVLVSKMLTESSTLRTESLYSACDECLCLLRDLLVAAAEEADIAGKAGHISRQADNLHWLLDILIARQAGEEFLTTWVAQAELAAAHSRVPVMQRYDVSRVTARLFVGVGKGQILVSKEARCELLRTWLVPFYEDFGWMRRACKGAVLDRRAVEEGLGNLVLTLPMPWQQEVLLGWFDRFLNAGEDCPKIQRAFEVWWRRAFWRRKAVPDRPGQLRIFCSESLAMAHGP